ncbi:CBU_0592 family membrane protein [Promicromonospora sp. Marseille-Q5078]
MTISLLTVITALGWVGALAVVLAYGMVSKGRWSADSLVFQLCNLGGALVMLLIAAVNGVWPSAFANIVAAAIGFAALRTMARARRTERRAAAQLAAAQVTGDRLDAPVVDGSADPTAGAAVLVEAPVRELPMHGLATDELPEQERVDLAA